MTNAVTPPATQTERLVIALAQCNVTVGDIAGNVAKILEFARRAASQGADLAVFPEMTVTGYPPEDLVLRPSFQQESHEALQQIAKAACDLPLALLVGGLLVEEGMLYNASFLIEQGVVLHTHRKAALPNYGVFDEKRVFSRGELPQPVQWRGITLGILICEDMWDDAATAALAAHEPQLLLVMNASPYEMGKARRRRNIAAERVAACRAPLVYLNLVGGQDELVFDGRSFVLNSDGADAARILAFQEELAITRWERHAASGTWHCAAAPLHATQGDNETIYQAMVLGLRDYVEKNRFPGVVLGLSGGIDSGITAAVAVDALGAERVRTLLLPSRYTSQESVEDAAECARLLGVALDVIAIEPGMAAFDAMLSGLFAGVAADTTEENIQARLRGQLLMAFSNKFGHMVLTTGNKSEMSVGYATLYGDMCGGYSVLKDVYKTTVTSLSYWRNGHSLPFLRGPEGPVIPLRMITKPPSAELKHNQKDQDTLPPYDVLDAILHALVEERLGVDDVVARGHARDVVVKVLRMLTRAEYKRRQAPPGVKITGMSFGKDWRYPITNRFRN